MAETGFRLRSSTNEDPYAAMVFITAANFTAGDITVKGSLVGVVKETSTSGDENVLVYEAAKIIVPCVAVTSGAFLVGAPVYFDAADKEVNESSSGNKLCGFVLEQPAVGAEEVLIHLVGYLGM